MPNLRGFIHKIEWSETMKLTVWLDGLVLGVIFSWWITLIATLVVFAWFCGQMARHKKVMRQTEDDWRQKISSADVILLRQQAAFQIATWRGKNVLAQRFHGNELHSLEQPLGVQPLTKEKEQLLYLLDDLCREEYERNIDVPMFRDHFYPLVRGYWLCMADVVCDARMKFPELWKYVFPVYDKYAKLTGQKQDFAKFNCAGFLDGEMPPRPQFGACVF
jgi:hypothetical protein